MDEKVYNALKVIKKEIEISRNMAVNSNVDFEKQINTIEKKVDNIEKSLEKLVALTKTSIENVVYTDRELYDMKQELSWAQLNKKTHIPLSTLQSRVRRYKKANDLF